MSTVATRDYAPQVPVRFNVDEAQAAGDQWGFNCGPGAVAAMLGLTIADVRPKLGDFERKGYTNPTLMLSILNNLGAKWGRLKDASWPRRGLVRVQWEGPWTRPGVPMAARYRHTHWVGAERVTGSLWIFDINAICVGGWIPAAEWREQIVPWLLKECEPKADGKWHVTHSLELDAIESRTHNKGE